jgi:hypothetical protein
LRQTVIYTLLGTAGRISGKGEITVRTSLHEQVPTDLSSSKVKPPLVCLEACGIGTGCQSTEIIRRESASKASSAEAKSNAARARLLWMEGVARKHGGALLAHSSAGASSVALWFPKADLGG